MVGIFAVPGRFGNQRLPVRITRRRVMLPIWSLNGDAAREIQYTCKAAAPGIFRCCCAVNQGGAWTWKRRRGASRPPP